MRIPEFTAALSLGKSRGHYSTRAFPGLIGSGSIQPQADWGCWCSEPDIRRVCTSPGHCYNKIVCLQWFCPGGGGGIDDGDGDGNDDDDLGE